MLHRALDQTMTNLNIRSKTVVGRGLHTFLGLVGYCQKVRRQLLTFVNAPSAVDCNRVEVTFRPSACMHLVSDWHTNYCQLA